VTNAQWKQVMGEIPASRFSNDDYPVANISHDQANIFCQALSALPEEQALGNAYRLPSVAEWEFACRAGTPTRYCCGDDASELGEYAWFNPYRDEISQERYQSRGGPAFVGTKRPNAWGLHDMHGNVREWIRALDSQEPMPLAATLDGLGGVGGSPAAENSEMSCGGSWFDPAERCGSRSAEVSAVGPATGFRVVLIPRRLRAAVQTE